MPNVGHARCDGAAQIVMTPKLYLTAEYRQAARVVWEGLISAERWPDLAACLSEIVGAAQDLAREPAYNARGWC